MDTQNVIQIQATVNARNNQGSITAVEIGHVYGDLAIQWHLIRPDYSLAQKSDLKHVIDEIEQRIFSISTQWESQDSQAVRDALFGPLLLKQLLTNYQRYQEQIERRPPGGGGLGRPPPAGDPSLHDLPCVDQEVVKAILRRSESNPRVVELSGPSGIGKSHLLNAIRNEKDRVSQAVHGKWKYVVAQPHDTFRDIMHDFIQALGCKAPKDVSINGLAQCLAGVIDEEEVDHVLFILDEADRVPDDVLVRLAGEEGPVGVKMRELLWTDTMLRLVIASRRMRFSAKVLDENPLLGLDLRPLDPLNADAVHEMLQFWMSQSKRSISPKENSRLRAFAQKIFEITGGHPRAVHFILQELRSLHFVLPTNDIALRFRSVVLEIVQRDIIGDLELSEYLALNVLGVFRHFDIGIVGQLIREGLLPANLVGKVNPSEKDVVDWLDHVCQTPAHIRRDNTDPTRPYHVHPVLRHVLPMDLENNQSEYLQKLHRRAFQLYDRRLRQRDTQGIHLATSLLPRCGFTFEALYHAVQACLVQMRGEAADANIVKELVQQAEEYCQLFCENFCIEPLFSGRNPSELHSQWKKDVDLHNRIVQVGGLELQNKLEQLFAQSAEQAALAA